MKILFLVFTMFFVGACSVSDALSLIKPNSGLTVDTSLSVDTADNIQKDINTKVDIGPKSTDTFTGDKTGVDKVTGNKIVNYNSDWHLIIVAILGWVFPSPKVMWNESTTFILKLFGRKPDDNK